MKRDMQEEIKLEESSDLEVLHLYVAVMDELKGRGITSLDSHALESF